LEAKYRNRWQGYSFTATSKRQLGSLLATTYQDRGQILPAMDSLVAGNVGKMIASDLYAIQKETGGGNLKLIESDNPLEADSHCDIAYSNALALQAGNMMVRSGGYS
jgi:hypothetical protein